MKEKIFKVCFNFLLFIMYGYMFSCMIGGIKITHDLYNIHYYSTYKCIENYVVFGLGTFFTFFVLITIIIISCNLLKNKKN